MQQNFYSNKTIQRLPIKDENLYSEFSKRKPENIDEEETSEETGERQSTPVSSNIADLVELMNEYYIKYNIIIYLQQLDFEYVKKRNITSIQEAGKHLIATHHIFYIVLVEENSTFKLKIDEHTTNPIGFVAIPVLEEGWIGKDYWDAKEQCSSIIALLNQHIDKNFITNRNQVA